MLDRIEIRLSGSGGQGLILAGIILAEAAILDGKNSVQTQSYGPEARGGASRAEVIISDGSIDYPKVTEPDIFLALTKEAVAKYLGDVKKGGKVIVDNSIGLDDFVLEGLKVFRIPIIETARERVKNEISANIIALGATTEITNIVSQESIIKAVLDRVPTETIEMNKKALYEGFELAK